MTRCTECIHDGYSYEFSRRTANFYDASRRCLKEGGTLAKYLDDDAYIKLNKCCRTSNQYWIGLVDKDECSNNLNGSYKWEGDTTCSNARPLNVIDQPNNQRCQAVTIRVHPNSGEGSIPSALETDCGNAQRYICQFPVSSTSPPPTSTRSLETTQKITTGKSLLTFTSKTSTYSSSLTTTTTSTPVDAQGAFNAGLTVGLAIGGLVLLTVALILLVFCLIQKGYLKKMKDFGNNNTSDIDAPQSDKFPKDNQVQSNPLYNSVISTQTISQDAIEAYNDGRQIIETSLSQNNTYEVIKQMEMNPYQMIEEKPKNKSHPSVHYEIDDEEGIYNKLYFPTKQDEDVR